MLNYVKGRMTTKTAIVVLMLYGMMHVLGQAQSADELVAEGRAFLAQQKLLEANACFASAVAASPDHPTANVLYGISRLAVLPYQPAGQNLLDRLGVSPTNRNIFHWTAGLPVDTNGVPIVPPDVNTTELIDYFQAQVLPQIQGAEANLAKITATNFLLTLSSNETSITNISASLAFGDVRAIQSVLHLVEFVGYLAMSQNLDAPLGELRSIFTGNGIDAEQMLLQHPLLLTTKSTNDLPKSRAAFEQFVVLFNEASVAFPTRDTNYNYLVSVSLGKLSPLIQLFLNTLKDSLQNPTPLPLFTTFTVYLGRLYDAPMPLRGFLPKFSHNNMVLGTLPDPTLGNLIQGVSRVDWETLLCNYVPTVPWLATYERLVGGRLQVQVAALKTHTYAIEVTSNLVQWARLGMFCSRDGWVSFQDTGIGSLPKKFYRAHDVANDPFADRATLPTLPATVYGQNSNATSELGERGYPTNKTVWWTWTPESGGRCGVSLAGTSFSGALDVFTGNSLDALTRITNGMGSSTYLEFEAVPGTAYQFSVGTEDGSGWYDDPGNIVLSLAFAPPNDFFANRISLTGTNASVAGHNMAASEEADEPEPHAYGGDRSVWYTWTAPANGKVTLALKNHFNVVLAVYTGSTLSALQLVVSDDSTSVKFDAVQGTTYQIRLNGIYNQAGPFTLQLSLVP
jgi:hypothetical protein